MKAPNPNKIHRYNELKTKVDALQKGDDDALEAILKAAVNDRVSETHIESLMSAGCRRAGLAKGPFKAFVAKEQADLKRRDDAEPDSIAERERAKEAEARAAELAKAAERESLFGQCKDIAESPTLLADMESIVCRLGVIGEGAAVRGAFISGISRLLRYASISYLRRGASAAGKNHPLLKILSLFARGDDYIRMTSASSTSLIYFGDGPDALKHKILFVGEAAAIAAKSNGDESPVTIMVRQLLSENQINHIVTLKQPDGSFKSENVQRDGPVSVWLTSARDNIESELLTRLQTSDADESKEQTRRVVRAGWLGKRSNVSSAEIGKWVAFQHWLRGDAPPDGYEVEIPFAEAIAAAQDEMIDKDIVPAQLRLRRDSPAFRIAIEASAVAHKALRDVDGNGRIVATLDDYRHAYDAFEAGAAALYDIKPDATLETALAKIIEIVLEEAESVDRDSLDVVSHKVSAEQLRQRLGVQSKTTAWDRINKLNALGAIEEDDSKRGRGRGAPCFYFIKKRNIVGLTGGVYPTPESVELRVAHSTFGRTVEREQKTEETLRSSRPTGYLNETEQQTERADGSTASARMQTVRSPDSVHSAAERELPRETSNFALVQPFNPKVGAETRNSTEDGGKGNGASSLTAKDRIDAARGAGAIIELNAAGGFNLDLDQVEPDLRQMLVGAIGGDEDAVLEALQAEAAWVSEKPKNEKSSTAGASRTGDNADVAGPPPVAEPGLGAAAESTDYYRAIAGAFMRSPGGEPDAGGRR